MTDLGTIGGDPCSDGFYLNERGQAIGISTDCNGTILHMFLWENGSMIDLSAQVLPGSGFTGLEPVVIDDRGEIVANGLLPNGGFHAVVLTPDGDRDEASEARNTATASSTARGAARQHLVSAREAPVLSPPDRFRNQMRQRYRLPGQLAAPLH